MRYYSTFSIAIATLSMSLLFACSKGDPRQLAEGWSDLPLAYADGFSLREKDGCIWIEVTQAFPQASKAYNYLVIPESSQANVDNIYERFDAVIRLPTSNIVLSSTTHIPHLDLLGVSDILAGFPTCSLVSSPIQRSRIEQEKVVELGDGAGISVEPMLELMPDWVMLSTLGGDLAKVQVFSTAGIPVILNGDYVESHPLGLAEWIKVTGALTGKLTESIEVFNQVVEAYEQAKSLVEEADLNDRPRVMSGVMYNDLWYAPGAESWGSILISDAGGAFLFDQKGRGGLPLSYEYVLDRAAEADYWIGAADYPSLKDLKAADPRYTHFSPFIEKQIFTYTASKGETGGLMYFELGYIRPDLVLKDLIKILHPQLLPDYDLFFYERLGDE